MLNIVKALLIIASAFAKIAERKQLLDAGADGAIRDVLEDALDKTNKAIAARRNTKHTADSVRNDPNNRNRR